METLISPSFWLAALVWAVSSFVVFLVPGQVILKLLRIQLSALSTFVVSLALGLSFWGVQAYVFGYLQQRELTYVYVIICGLAAVIERRLLWRHLKLIVRGVLKSDKLALTLLLVGAIAQTLQMVGSGLASSSGLAFWRVNMQDGIYHMSLITTMMRSFPPLEPGFAGHLLINYHYWSDLILADQARIFRLAPENLFFQFVPILFSIATGLALWSLLRVWGAGKVVIRFGLFFLFFGSDAGYLMAYLIHGVFSFQYPVIDTGVLQFLNMPHVFAKFVFLASLSALHFWIKEKKWKWGLVTVLLTAVLFGLKIYFALYAVLGLSLIGLITLGRAFLGKQPSKLPARKLLIQMLALGVCGALGALAIYLPPNHGSGGLTYVPLAWPNLFLAQGNLDWMDWRYKLAVAALLKLRFKVYFYDLEAIIVTLIAVHGTRLLGFVVSRKTMKKLGLEWVVYLLVPTALFTFLGLYTMQVSGGYNVHNFFAMSLTLLAILVAFLAADLWSWRNLVGKLVVALILVLTLPRAIYETQKILSSYRDQTDVLFISQPELATLRVMNQVLPSNCVVATSTGNELDMNTPYVSYLAHRLTFMSGETVLETHSQPTEDRFSSYRRLFESGSGAAILAGLRTDGVCALYIKREDPEFGKITASHPAVYFENNVAAVIKTN